MSEWSSASLSSVVVFKNGLNFSERNTGTGLPIVKVKDFGDRHFVEWQSLDEINPIGLNVGTEYLLQPDDIVIVRSNGNKDLVGRSMLFDGPSGMVSFAGFCIRGRVRTEYAWPRFIHYWLRSPKTRERFSREGSGTGIQNVSQALLNSLDIELPSIKEQREIATILGTLDDKIELNRKTSATLEAMARALYRSWFVDFDPVHAKAEGRAPAHMDASTAALFPDSFGEDGLPQGWSFDQLSTIAENPRTAVKPQDLTPDTTYIGLEHMPRRSIALSNWGGVEDISSQKSRMERGDFLFGKLRPYFHKVGISPVAGVCSTDILVVRAKAPLWAGIVLSTISSEAFVEYTNSGSSGTRMPRTNWRDMAAFLLALPPVEIASAYEVITRPIRERIITSVHESQTLAQLRDTLLPRLMSGELRVQAAEEMIEEAL